MTTEILRIERKLKAFMKLFMLYGCIPMVVFPFAEEQTFRLRNKSRKKISLTKKPSMI